MNLFLQIVYMFLTAYLIVIIGWNLIKTKKKSQIVSALMILVLLILRLFLIK